MNIITTLDTYVGIEAGGKRSNQPLYWLKGQILYAAGLGEMLTITPAGDQRLISLSTNGQPGHRVLVHPDTMLVCYDGRPIPASAVGEGTQLKGDRGMYVVTGKPKRVTEKSFSVNTKTASGLWIAES